MRRRDTDFRAVLSAIADYIEGNPGQEKYNTQTLAAYVRFKVGEDKLPSKSSGRIFECLYSRGVFQRANNRSKTYFVFINKALLGAFLRQEGGRICFETEADGTSDIGIDIEVSYSLGGQLVSDEFYNKFSSRFTEEEKGVTYTFRGYKVPQELHPLVESVLDKDG